MTRQSLRILDQPGGVLVLNAVATTSSSVINWNQTALQAPSKSMLCTSSACWSHQEQEWGAKAVQSTWLAAVPSNLGNSQLPDSPPLQPQGPRVLYIVCDGGLQRKASAATVGTDTWEKDTSSDPATLPGQKGL